MKKAYKKPELYFENFELSTSIATGCGVGYNHSNTNFSNARDCNFFYDTDKVFLNTDNCTMTEFDENMFCYHVPTANNKVFSS